LYQQLKNNLINVYFAGMGSVYNKVYLNGAKENEKGNAIADIALSLKYEIILEIMIV